MRNLLVVMLVALVSDVVVPGLTGFVSSQREAVEAAGDGAGGDAEAEEGSEAEEGPEAEDEGGGEGELERLREENRLLKELVGEKELALRSSQDE